VVFKVDKLALLLSSRATVDDDSANNVGDFTLLYDVDQEHFMNFVLVFPPKLRNTIFEGAASHASFQNFMEAVDKSIRGYIFASYPWRTLEILVPVLWGRGVEWKTMGPTGNLEDLAIDLPIRMSFTLQRAESVEEMEEDTIYVPGNSAFAFVAMYFKHEGIVHGIQFKAGYELNSPRPSGVFQFRKEIGLEDTDDLYVWYVTFHEVEEMWKKIQKGFRAVEDDAAVTDDQKQRFKSVLDSTHLGLLTQDFDTAWRMCYEYGKSSQAFHVALSTRSGRIQIMQCLSESYNATTVPAVTLPESAAGLDSMDDVAGDHQDDVAGDHKDDVAGDHQDDVAGDHQDDVAGDHQGDVKETSPKLKAKRTRNKKLREKRRRNK
jgi:hypothetical protein